MLVYDDVVYNSLLVVNFPKKFPEKEPLNPFVCFYDGV